MVSHSAPAPTWGSESESHRHDCWILPNQRSAQIDTRFLGNDDCRISSIVLSAVNTRCSKVLRPRRNSETCAERHVHF